ncbi:MAG: serine/threonine-protein kinase [Verrucomicrobiota bacterium]
MKEPPFGLLAMLGTTEFFLILIVLAVAVASVALGIGLLVWAVTRLTKSSRPPIPPSPPGGGLSAPIPSPMDPPPVGQPCPRCKTLMTPGALHGVCPKCALAAGFATQPVSDSPDPRSGPRTPAPNPIDLAPHFPNLEILSLIGHGGMGWVYQARQPNLDRKVALKILPPGTGVDPAFAERFRREARALARLSHPNIVALHDFGQAGPYFYLVMEYVDGTNLRDRLRTRRLTPEEAFAIVPEICAALQFAHDAGVVHRDVKPENILLDARGRVKLADFGIAKMARGGGDITLTGPRDAMGTPHYMAPEQLESPDSVDHRADIYALGVVFYEMLTGGLPLGRFEPPSRGLHMDVRMDEVVLRSLERDPDRRYQSATAVKSDVERIHSETGPVPSSTPS